MERRGRIPVAKFRTQEAKVRSRSRVREPDYNEQDPETDLFTLLEDNIALKEENKALKLEIEEHKRSYNEQLERNNVIDEELRALKQQQSEFENQVKALVAKHNKSESERNALDKLNKLKAEQLNSLTNELQLLRLEQRSESRNNDDTPLIDSAALKTKIMKILPTFNSGNGNELESFVELESSKSLSITKELVECLVEEYSLLKNQMNSVELQLYEANEKIAELIENQHHLEEENETLRNENTNLTNVAKLLTENMKESVETSKKMESALIKLKQRNDELVAKSRDLLDGQPVPSPSPTTKQANEEFALLQEAVHNQNADHNERIVEMKTLMDVAIQKNTNDALKTLQVKLDILEEELRKANARAEYAEKELEKYKNAQQMTAITCAPAPPPIPPPPPPPPLPPVPLHIANIQTMLDGGGAGDGCKSFSDSIALFSSQKASGSKVIENVKQQVQVEATTGLDALVREFKSGRVTLRRNRRKTRTNDALQEMFQVLESSQKQNRNSKICIDMHI